jgi:hypothetical protein
MNIYIFIYVYISIYVYVYMFKCTFMYVNIYANMNICIYTYIYIHMHIHIHIYIHMCIYVICVYTHARTTHTYTHTNKSAVHATTFPQGIQHVTKPDNLFLLDLHAKSYRHDQWHIPRQGRATPCVTWTTGVTWLILSSWCNRMTHRCDMTRMCAMVHSHDDRLHNGRQCQVNACVTWLVCLTFDMPIQPPSLISVISHIFMWHAVWSQPPTTYCKTIQRVITCIHICIYKNVFLCVYQIECHFYGFIMKWSRNWNCKSYLLYKRIHTCMCTQIYVCKYINICVYVYIYTYTYTYLYI